MNAPLTKVQRQALEKLLNASEGEKNRERNVRRAPEIRRLALDGLDDKAIAAQTGAAPASVRMVVARMRRSLGVKFRRRGVSKIGVLVDLPDDLRGLLQIEAVKRGIGPNSLANQLLDVLLRSDGVAKILDR